MSDHRIVTRLHITDIDTRTVYAVQASCVCGWLGRIRHCGEWDPDVVGALGASREQADKRAAHDGEDHLWTEAS